MADDQSEPEAKTEDEPKAEHHSQVQAQTDRHESDSKTNGKKTNKLTHFKLWYGQHKKLSIPLSVAVVILLLLALPMTRYPLLGIALKKNYSLQVLDSETKAAVSGATVSYGSVSTQTDGNGIVVLPNLKVGKHSIMISKKYYKDGAVNALVPVLSQKSKPVINLVATGRQVKISVLNTISKKPLAGVNIKVADVTAETDASGKALLVLPVGIKEQPASLSFDGYNDSNVKVKISDSKIEENNFTLTPKGKIYFLSKRTGKISVMKSNLDGTDQTEVVPGTGKEDESDTVLLASRDWKFLALKAKRDDSPAKLYFIDTSVDKLNTLDEGDASFTMIGWSDHNFVYKVSRNGIANWQPNREALKSFNAETAKLIVLSQTNATGTSNSDYAHETFGYSSNYLIDGKLIFTKDWDSNYYSTSVNGKQAGIYSINVDGSGFKTLHTTDLSQGQYYYLNSVLYEPDEIYYQISAGGEPTYFKYSNGSVSTDDSIKDNYAKFTSNAYPTYLLSPSGKQTFWVEPRDGKSAFLVGGTDGGNQKEVAKLDIKFQNYGYYSDDYLLVSKDSDEIYAMPAAGVNDESSLIKITDYHKPAYNFYGYGGGYGGL